MSAAPRPVRARGTPRTSREAGVGAVAEAEDVAGLLEHGGVQVVAAGAADASQASMLTRMSPDQVPAVTSNGEEKASTVAEVRRRAMRMSPKRASPWARPAVPNAWPPSATTPMLMRPATAQVWKARRMSRCQTARGATASRASEQVAGLAADRGAVGGEAQGQVGGVRPGVAPGGGDAAVFEALDGRGGYAARRDSGHVPSFRAGRAGWPEGVEAGRAQQGPRQEIPGAASLSDTRGTSSAIGLRQFRPAARAAAAAERRSGHARGDGPSPACSRACSTAWSDRVAQAALADGEHLVAGRRRTPRSTSGSHCGRRPRGGSPRCVAAGMRLR